MDHFLSEDDLNRFRATVNNCAFALLQSDFASDFGAMHSFIWGGVKALRKAKGLLENFGESGGKMLSVSL